MRSSVDKILIGSINDENLEKKGEICFKRYSEKKEHLNESSYYLNFIIGKRLHEEEFWNQGMGALTKSVSKQRFLEAVNEDLSEMNSYLAEAKYSNPFFGRQKVKGILYKEITE